MSHDHHITVAAMCERDGKYLVIEERANGKLVFNQPAGHLERDESLLQAVVRETREESGWQFQPTALLGLYLWQHPQKHSSILRLAIIGDCSDHNPQQALDDGIERALWMSRDELAASGRLRSPLVLQSIDDYIHGQRLPLSAMSDLVTGYSA